MQETDGIIKDLPLKTQGPRVHRLGGKSSFVSLNIFKNITKDRKHVKSIYKANPWGTQTSFIYIHVKASSNKLEHQIEVSYLIYPEKSTKTMHSIGWSCSKSG